METITISKKKYEELLSELEKFRGEREGAEDELLEQVKESLEDVKAGRVTKAYSLK